MERPSLTARALSLLVLEASDPVLGVAGALGLLFVAVGLGFAALVLQIIDAL